MVKFQKKKKKNSNKFFPPRICKFFYLRSIESRSHIRISNLWRQRAREPIRVSVNRMSIGEVGRTESRVAMQMRHVFFLSFPVLTERAQYII